jgi:UDP-glucose 4-epimerase
MKILVTGAAGFIASHLIPAFRRIGTSLVLTDIRPLGFLADHAAGFFQWDIRNEREIRSFVEEARDCTAVVHLAAIAAPRQCADDPSVAWETNVRGTQNVLELAHLANIPRVIFLSSSHVYGISPRYMPTDEPHPLWMHDSYTTTKILGEQLCALHYQNHGTSYVAVRLFNSYGFGQSKDYFIGAKIRQAMTERRVVVKGPVITKDWIEIRDAVSAIVALTVNSYVGPLNVGTGTETSLQVIGKQIAESLDVPYSSEPTDDPGPSRMCADSRRAQRILDWWPRIDVREGLKQLIIRAKAEAAEEKL